MVVDSAALLDASVLDACVLEAAAELDPAVPDGLIDSATYPYSPDDSFPQSSYG